MKKFFTVFALVVAVVFVTSVGARAAEKFAAAGPITDIQWAQINAAGVITDLCMTVDLNGTEWPIIVSPLCPDTIAVGLNPILRDIMIAGLPSELDVQLTITFGAPVATVISGLELGDPADCIL